MSRPARIATGLVLLAALVGAGLSLLRVGIYGLTIFVLVPVLLGGIVCWIYPPRDGWQAAGRGALAVLVASGLLMIVAVEGLVCIAMVLPLALPLGALGGWMAYRSQRFPAATMPALILLTPASLAFDTHARPPLYEVRSAVTIAAAPDVVWKNVISFSDLPEPREWYFRSGIAYPERARIVGSGPGAVRYCEFSTGPFVEPIEVWNSPRLLRFRVTENPAPMAEFNPFAHVVPKHLHGYFVSEHGQFLLTPLPGNRTLLEGTTWYRHGLWPAGYWRWWSDAIIHRIHMRVLDHIRALSESAAAMSSDPR